MPLADLDARVFYALYGGDGGGLRGVAVALSFVGGGWGLVGLTPLFFMPAWRRFAATLLMATASSALLVYALKRVFGRARPFCALQSVHALCPPPTDASFPSGHATGSFTVAVFLLVVFWATGRRTLGVVAVAFAVMVAWSRIYLGVHFPLDVVVGALLGAVFGAAFGRRYLMVELPVGHPKDAEKGGVGLAG